MILEFIGVVEHPCKLKDHYTKKVEDLKEKLLSVIQFDYCRYPVKKDVTGLKIQERVPAEKIGVTVEEGSDGLLDLIGFLKAMSDRTGSTNAFSKRNPVSTMEADTTGKTDAELMLEAHHSPRAIALWHELRQAYFESPEDPNTLIKVGDEYLDRDKFYFSLIPGTQFALPDGTAKFMILENEELMILDSKTGAGALDQFIDLLELEYSIYQEVDDDYDNMKTELSRYVEPDVNGKYHVDWRTEKLFLGSIDNKDSWQIKVKGLSFLIGGEGVFYLKEHYLYYDDTRIADEFIVDLVWKYLVKEEMTSNYIKINYV